MHLRLAMITATVLTGACIASAHAADPYGIWMRGDGNARVRIAPCGANICATNLWIKDTSKGEAVGDKLIMSLKRDSATLMSGTAYDPKRKRSYSIKLTIGRHGLTTRGCILAGLLCKSVAWSPVK